MSVVDYIKNNFESRKILNILELGSGDQKEAPLITNYIKGKYFAIDIHRADQENLAVSFICENYFNIDKINNKIKNVKFDLIFSSYSICFNKKDTIIERLPFYFEKISSGGIFYLSDFCSDEVVVKNRTNLDEAWFLELIKKYFKTYTISKRVVYEEEHRHSHSIFELIAYK